MYPDLSWAIPVICWKKLPSGGVTLLKTNFPACSWASAVIKDESSKMKRASFFRNGRYFLLIYFKLDKTVFSAGESPFLRVIERCGRVDEVRSCFRFRVTLTGITVQ
jgi:hypothetical protein